MFRLLRVIIRPSSELIQNYLIPSALWDIFIDAQCFRRILKLTIKQILHVSVQSPSSRSEIFELAKVIVSGFGGQGVACWPLVPKFAGSNPAEAVGFLRAKKSSARLPSEGK